MPTSRKYASGAARQAAYRLRGKAKAEAVSPGGATPGVPGRRRWRAMCEQACRLLERIGEEMATYYEDRSEAWRESERGEEFSELMESFAEIGAALTEVRAL